MMQTRAQSLYTHLAEIGVGMLGRSMRLNERQPS